MSGKFFLKSIVDMLADCLDIPAKHQVHLLVQPNPIPNISRAAPG